MKNNKSQNWALDLLNTSSFFRNKFKPIAPFFKNEGLVELRINRPQEVTLEYQDGTKVIKKIEALTKDQLELLALALAGNSGQKFNERNPILATKLPGGHRVQINGFDAVASGFGMTVRIRKDRIFELEDFGIDSKTAKLIKSFIKDKKTILVSGGTGTGKTSLTNALILEIPADERLISIEDVQELDLSSHLDRLELIYSSNTTSLSGLTANDLLRSALRHNPDRILVGEVQNENALSFANAINTGHEGSIGTIHANSPQGAVVSLISKIIIGGAGDNAIGILQRQICNDIFGVIQINKNHTTNKRTAYFEEIHELGENKEIEKQIVKQLKNTKEK